MGFFDLFKKKEQTQQPQQKKRQEACSFSKLSVASPGPYEAPTEKQLAYAKDLGIRFPDDVSKGDMTCLISRAVGDDSEKSPASDIVDLAMALDIKFSPYIGADGLLRLMFFSAADAQRGAMYAYAIHQRNAGKPFSNFYDDPDTAIYLGIGERIAADPKLRELLKERPPEDLTSPRKGTKIYNTVSGFLEENKL